MLQDHTLCHGLHGLGRQLREDRHLRQAHDGLHLVGAAETGAHIAAQTAAQTRLAAGQRLEVVSGERPQQRLLAGDGGGRVRLGRQQRQRAEQLTRAGFQLVAVRAVTLHVDAAALDEEDAAGIVAGAKEILPGRDLARLQLLGHGLQRMAGQPVDLRRLGELLDQVILHLRDEAAEVLAQLEADGRLRHDDGAQILVAQLPVFEFGGGMGAHIIGERAIKAVLAQHAAGTQGCQVAATGRKEADKALAQQKEAVGRIANLEQHIPAGGLGLYKAFVKDILFFGRQPRKERRELNKLLFQNPFPPVLERFGTPCCSYRSVLRLSHRTGRSAKHQYLRWKVTVQL